MILYILKLAFTSTYTTSAFVSSLQIKAWLPFYFYGTCITDVNLWYNSRSGARRKQNGPLLFCFSFHEKSIKVKRSVCNLQWLLFSIILIREQCAYFQCCTLNRNVKVMDSVMRWKHFSLKRGVNLSRPRKIYGYIEMNVKATILMQWDNYVKWSWHVFLGQSLKVKLSVSKSCVWKSPREFNFLSRWMRISLNLWD